MPSLADFLAAYGGSPDPENPSSGEITPGLVLRAIGHATAPGLVAPPVIDPDQVDPARGSAFTPPKTSREYATELSAGKNKPPDPLETMLGVAGGSPATFIGPGALTWNRQAAAEAERMLAAGASRREIEAKTGTSFNAAMQPQQERSDASMTVDMNRVARAIESGERAVPAGEIYKDWHLFRDYPEMAQWPVDLNNPFFQSAQFRNQKVSGAMDMGLSPPALLINPKEVTSATDIRSMGGHELGGHGVSRIEKFPSGGGFETPVVVAQAERALPQRVEAYQKTMKDVGDRAAAWAMEQTGGDQAKAATIIHQYFDLNPDEARLMSGALQEKAKYNRGRMGLEERFKAYQSLAGESDARNIQKRLDMTPEQLAATSREDTQDIPFADQLIHYAPYNNEALPKRPTQGDFGFSTELPSFSDRMAGARDVAFAGRQRGTGNILPRSTANEAPLLAPGETRGDLVGSLTPGMAPAETSIADIGRNTYRDRLFAQRLDPAQLELSSRLKKEPQAPAVLRPDRPLFDLSPQGLARSHVQREQFDIPRTAAETVTPEYERATSRANIARVNKEVAQGIKEHGLDWHAMGQLRDRYIAELGQRAGAAEFERYMQEVGATSPNSNVEQNFRTASYYAQQRRAGEPLPQIAYKRSTGNPYLPPREAPPTPYGNTAQGLHVMNLGLLERGEPYPLSRPKVPSFTENMLGNYRPVAVDRHNLRMWGIDAEAPNLTGYKHLERTQQEQAGKMGVHPAQYQAAPWPYYAKSGADPALALFDKRVTHTAEQRGQTKAQVLRDFIRGQAPLLSLTPAAVLLGQGQPAPEPAP